MNGIPPRRDGRSLIKPLCSRYGEHRSRSMFVEGNGGWEQQMDTSRSPGAAAARSLWFNPPDTDEQLRPPLTRQRVVAKALTLIAQEGVEALTMRTLAARL